MLRIVSGCVFFLLTLSLAVAKDDPPNLIAGKKVEADTKLQKGDKLVGVWEKKNYVVEVLEVKTNRDLRIRWVSTGEETDDVPQTTLYYAGDSAQTRKLGKSPLPDVYQKLDKNGDGQIGLYEWDRAKYAEFKKLDKNHDGILTPQELIGKSVVVAALPGTAGAAKEGDPKDAKDATELPKSGNLVDYEERTNESFTFTVTGRIIGGVWGTGMYATESDLAAVAVHAGVLKDGATGSVKVTIVPAADKFTGSVMNGVTSVDRQEAGPAFTVEAVKNTVEAAKK